MNQPSLFEHQVCQPIKPYPYGLPYQGSKRAIAFDLIKTMHRMKPKAKYFYDLFGGGGTMSFMALQWGYDVFYNELDTGIYNLINFLKSNPLPPDWWEPVSRDKFHRIKNLTDPKSVAQSLCWSFSNARRTYLGGQEIEDLKIQLYTQIYKKIASHCFPTYSPSIYKNFADEKRGAENLEPLQRTQRLQSLQALQRIQRIQRITTSNLSFDKVKILSNPDETIIYLDPPYRETAGYRGGEFNNALVDKYMAESNYTVFMSEYEAPFRRIGEFKRRALMLGAKTKQNKNEGLFWNGK